MAEGEKIRLDKWLWAARFFKKRALATEAIEGGHVHLNGTRVKPARAVQVGDELRVRRGQEEFTVTVLALSTQRGPASVASGLYEENEASRAAREQQAEERRLMRLANPQPARRPDKRSRRQIHRFIRKE